VGSNPTLSAIVLIFLPRHIIELEERRALSSIVEQSADWIVSSLGQTAKFSTWYL
jgi:hypothetical protein